MKVGFVGLGVMGGPMAGHLLKSGHDIVVWNRTASKAKILEESGAQVAPSLEELGATCEVVFICVNRSEDVRECLDALTKNACPNTLFVDHSTISPTVAKELHKELGQKGLRFIDAPITGGSMGAQKGQLTIFCGGNEQDIEDARPLMECYAKRIAYMGEAGAGQMTKMANQIAVGGSLLGLCEALSFAKKAGLDTSLVKEVVGSGAAGSWAFDNYGPKVLAEDWSPGFSVKNQRKDFGYCKEAAQDVDAAIPGTELVDHLLAVLEDRGDGEWATAALYEVILELDRSREMV